MKNSVKMFTLALVGGGLLLANSPAMARFFRDDDVTVIRQYVPAPPTTQKVTVYSTGEVLPGTVTYTELPSTVTTKLVAPPEGDTYVTIGGNAYLIDKDRRVVDTITLY